MVPMCTVPARGGRLCEYFDGYKTINRIPLPFISSDKSAEVFYWIPCKSIPGLSNSEMYTIWCISGY